MKNCKNLTTSEVQMIMNGASMFVMPFKNQPRGEYGDIVTDLAAGVFTSTIVNKYGDEDAGPDVWGAISGYEEWCWTAPFQPGQVIYGREKWCRGRIDAGELPDGREDLYVSQCLGEEDAIPYEYCLRQYS